MLRLLHTTLRYTALHYNTLPLALVVRYGYHVGPCLLREVYFIHWTFRKLTLLPSSEFSALLCCLAKVQGLHVYCYVCGGVWDSSEDTANIKLYVQHLVIRLIQLLVYQPIV